jgi:hypothetical protein
LSKFALILLLVLLIQCSVNGQPAGIVDNDKIFTVLLNEGLNRLTDILTVSGKDKIYFVSSAEKDKKFEYIVMNLRKTFPDFKFITGEINVKPDYKLHFNNLILKTNYKNLSSNPIKGKEVIRELTVNYNVNLIFNDSSFYSDVFFKKYDDKIPYDNIPDVEYGADEFAKGKIPEGNFGERLLIPLIVAAVSAVAVILFYSIRSK